MPSASALAHLRTPQLNDDEFEYLEILHLRTDHIEGEAIIVPGVEAGYDPAQLVATLRAQPAS